MTPPILRSQNAATNSHRAAREHFSIAKLVETGEGKEPVRVFDQFPHSSQSVQIQDPGFRPISENFDLWPPLKLTNFHEFLPRFAKTGRLPRNLADPCREPLILNSEHCSRVKIRNILDDFRKIFVQSGSSQQCHVRIYGRL